MKTRFSCHALILGLVASVALALPACSSPGPLRVYVGTYTRGDKGGIYLLEMDPETGALTTKGVTRNIINPSFLALDPSGRHLYAVSETANFEGTRTGSVSAYAVDAATGALAFLNSKPSGGAGPCHLVVDRTGKNVLVANYGAGSVSVLRIEDDGRLGKQASLVQHEGSSVNPKRQKGPHAHCVTLGPDNRCVFVSDLGIDKVVAYALDASTGVITPREDLTVALEPGAGPRHMVFHSDGRHAYLISELASTVTVLDYAFAQGSVKKLQTISTLPAGFQGSSTTAEIAVHPSGAFLYGSNRGHDSIAIFAIDAKSSTLSSLGTESTRGKTPRNFAIDPSGRFLLAANQSSDTVVVFRIDPGTGKLASTGCVVNIPAPVCVLPVIEKKT